MVEGLIDGALELESIGFSMAVEDLYQV